MNRTWNSEIKSSANSLERGQNQIMKWHHNAKSSHTNILLVKTLGMNLQNFKKENVHQLKNSCVNYFFTPCIPFGCFNSQSGCDSQCGHAIGFWIMQLLFSHGFLYLSEQKNIPRTRIGIHDTHCTFYCIECVVISVNLGNMHLLSELLYFHSL